MAKKILYIQYTNPGCYPPLQHSSKILAEKGWKVFFLGTGSFGESDRFAVPNHLNISMKRIFFCPAGKRQKFHYLWFSLLAIFKTLWLRPQWIYASDPNSCPAVLPLRALFNKKIIYHEHDSPSESFNKHVMRARMGVAAVAKLCILPNENRMKKFIRETGRLDSICVLNYPLKEDVFSRRAKSISTPLTIYYHGALNNDHIPVTVIHAMRMLPAAVKLRIVGYETIGSAGHAAKLLGEAKKLNMDDRLELHGPVASRREMLQNCSECDIGLAFVPKKSADINNTYKAGASNKAFEYLACGLALLVSDAEDWRGMFVEPGYGLACDPDDPSSIARALRFFLEHTKEASEMGERGRQRILSEWNYEKQFEPVLKMLSA